jgi:hypothetical protein
MRSTLSGPKHPKNAQNCEKKMEARRATEFLVATTLVECVGNLDEQGTEKRGNFLSLWN